jgi:hypothetical protein
MASWLLDPSLYPPASQPVPYGGKSGVTGFCVLRYPGAAVQYTTQSELTCANESPMTGRFHAQVDQDPEACLGGV